MTNTTNETRNGLRSWSTSVGVVDWPGLLPPDRSGTAAAPTTVEPDGRAVLAAPGSRPALPRALPAEW